MYNTITDDYILQWIFNSSDGTFHYGMDLTKCLDAGSSAPACQGADVKNLPFWYDCNELTALELVSDFSDITLDVADRVKGSKTTC